MGRLRVIEGGQRGAPDDHVDRTHGPGDELDEIGDDDATVLETAQPSEQGSFEDEVDAALSVLSEVDVGIPAVAPSKPEEAAGSYASSVPVASLTPGHDSALPAAAVQTGPFATPPSSPGYGLPPGYPARQPAYMTPAAGYPPPGYAPPGFAPPGYPPSGYAQSGYMSTGPFTVVPGMGASPGEGAASAPARSNVAWIIGIGLVMMLGIGLVLGWAVFARRRDSVADTHPATALATTTATNSVPAPTAPARPAAVAPVRSPVTAELAELAHPELAKIIATARGEVATIAPATPSKAGDTVFTIRVVQVDTARATALSHRIAELEALAKQDPSSYGPFLARARRDLARTRRVVVTPIKATATGLVVSNVKVGDTVEVGDELGTVVDGQRWLGQATVHDRTLTASWSCAVATPDNAQSAACAIQSTELLEGGTGAARVKVAIMTSDAPWLRDLNQRARIVLEPPSAP